MNHRNATTNQKIVSGTLKQDEQAGDGDETDYEKAVV